MTRFVKINGVYKHFKGQLYIVEGIALDSETQKSVVVYRALYGEGQLYVRDLDMFMSKVDKDKYPDVDQEYRFEFQYVKDSDTCPYFLARPQLEFKIGDIVFPIYETNDGDVYDENYWTIDYKGNEYVRDEREGYPIIDYCIHSRGAVAYLINGMWISSKDVYKTFERALSEVETRNGE